MINFFRKIRRKLADNNKPLKYMRYAIGEIALVMIGILLALQVNTWNEGRKSKKVEATYFKNLLVDLAFDTTYFEDRIVLMNSAIKNQYTYLSMSYEKQESLDEVIELFSYFDLTTKHLVIQNPTYEDIISSGNLSIFSNVELKKAIMAYYKLYEITSINIKEYNLVSTEYMIEADRVAPNATKFYDATFYNSTMYYDGEWDYLNYPLSKEFLALQLNMNIYLDRNKQHIKVYEHLIDNANSLIQFIQAELVE